MKRNINLKSILKQKKLTIGSWLTINSPKILEIMLQMKFDWIVIDLEHSTISLSEAEDLIRIIELYNKIPLVRLSSNNEQQAKRVLDAGAKGLIVPMIKNLSDAKKAISYIHYPPKGNRSVGLSRGNMYGLNFDESFKQSFNNSLILQIEHIEAVKNIDDILSLKEVDGIMIGPYDLTGSMGIPGKFNNPKFKRMISHIEKKVKNYSVSLGIHMIKPKIEDLKKNIKNKYNFISYSLDTEILIDSLINISKFIEKIKK